MTLALTGFTPCLIFLGLTLKNAYDVRLNQTMAKNANGARVLALLLSERCNSAETLLRTAEHSGIGSGPGSAERARIRQMVTDNPSMAFAALCGPDGRVTAAYPAALIARTQASKARLLKEIGSSHSQHAFDLYRLPDAHKTPLLAAIIPIGRQARPYGYLLSFTRTTGVDAWFREIGARDRLGIALIKRGAGVLDVAGPIKVSEALADSRAVPPNLKRNQDGALVTPAVNKKDPNVLGYAVARVPGWVVQVTQPLSSAQAANYALFPLLVLLVVVCSVLLFLAALRFSQLYDRLESMQLTLVEQNRSLRGQDEAKSKFLANVSHDLWTPMASLEMSLTGLLDHKIQWTPEQVQQSLILAHYELTRLITRVRNLLEMARLEANADLEEMVPCDLQDIAGSALERLGPLLKNRPIYSDFPDEPLICLCRHAQMEIVIINLIDNALKYSPPGSPFSLRGGWHDDNVKLSLGDCGPGVQEQERERIFEPYYRAPKTRSKGGTGLGLAICKAILEGHGGKIWVEDSPSGGAEFWLEIPGLTKERLV
jgi:signal transduction histidine kinase